jgi:hypothetical protein
MQILFDPKTAPLTSIGRNGSLKTIGIELVESCTITDAGKPIKTVKIFPITSKGNLGNCMISVPEDVLISLSQQYTSQRRRKKT